MGFLGEGARLAFLLTVLVQLRVSVMLSRDQYSGEAIMQSSLLPASSQAVVLFWARNDPSLPLGSLARA